MNNLERPPVAGQFSEKEGGECVRDRLRRVVNEACAFDELLRVGVDALPVALFQPAAGDPLGRVLGVEIIRLPLDPGAEPALQPCRPFQSDIAERSYVVRPDLDGRATGRNAHIFYLPPQ